MWGQRRGERGPVRLLGLCRAAACRTCIFSTGRSMPAAPLARAAGDRLDRKQKGRKQPVRADGRPAGAVQRGVAFRSRRRSTSTSTAAAGCSKSRPPATRCSTRRAISEHLAAVWEVAAADDQRTDERVNARQSSDLTTEIAWPNASPSSSRRAKAPIPAKRQLEEDIVAGLLMEPGIDVVVIPHLYDLKPDGTGMLGPAGDHGRHDRPVVALRARRRAGRSTASASAARKG